MDKGELALTIRELRKKAKLTQDELAARSHVDRNTIQRIEKAETSTTIETLWQILPILNAELNIRSGGEKGKSEIVGNVEDFIASIDRRLAALESQRLTSSPEEPILIAWRGAEEWRRALAMFFLTGDLSHLESTAIDDEMRKRLSSTLRFHKMEPRRGAR